MAVNQTVHFTDWVVGHSHLAMLGFATFAAAGGLVHAWQRTAVGALQRAGARLDATGCWSAGVVLMVVDLTTGRAGARREPVAVRRAVDRVGAAARPYWVVRAHAGVLMAAGFVALLVGLTTGRGAPGAAWSNPASARAGGRVSPRLGPLPAGCVRWPTWTRAAHVLPRGQRRGRGVLRDVGGAARRVAGARARAADARPWRPNAPLGLTASEQRGRAIYGREGCAYCHTQQVRFLHADMTRFGAPTLAWETQVDYPHLWGTRRIGPDLARRGGRALRGLALRAPVRAARGGAAIGDAGLSRALRRLAPASATGGARSGGVPRDAGPRRASWPAPEGEARARERCNCPDDEMAQMAFEAARSSTRTPRARGPRADGPVLPPASDDPPRPQAVRRPVRRVPRRERRRRRPRRGRGCVRGPPTSPSTSYTRARLSDALWHGVAGTAMPAWRDHRVEDLAAMAHGRRIRAGLADVDAADGPRRPAGRAGRRSIRPTARSATAPTGTAAARRPRSCAWPRPTFRRQRASLRTTLARHARRRRGHVDGRLVRPPERGRAYWPSPTTSAASSCRIRPGQGRPSDGRSRDDRVDDPRRGSLPWRGRCVPGSARMARAAQAPLPGGAAPL